MNEERLLPVIRELTDFINISVDAATESTYNKVRKGGAFKKLMNNVRDFDERVIRGEFARIRGWQLNFIVQEDNFREIVPFAEWALSHKTATNIWFNLIADWGHLSKQAFEKKAVWMKDHPCHGEFLEILKSPVLKDPKIQLGNMTSYI
jgi:molybdenum cofactor biosynthesis enzyme MoaA